MNKKYLLLFLLPMLLLPGCSKASSRELPSTLMWDKDQELIHPADGTLNIWEGFAVKEGHFAAERDFAQFILWRRHKAMVEINIEYSLKGNKIEFAVNVDQKKMLLPSLAFRREKFAFQLSRGFNFLGFIKKSKDTLKIRSIGIGTQQEKPRPHLEAGQSFSLFHLPGKGRLDLDGRGTVEITWRQTVGETLIAKSEKLQSGFLSGKISRHLEFTSPGLLTVKAEKGSFNIRAYSYVPKIDREADLNITFKSKPNIYMVLSDACQASHLGIYGYARNTSPHIDAFAKDAIVYENAYANAAYTFASVATLFTGFYPDHHGMRLLFSSLPQQYLTLFEYLKTKSYSTSMITTSFVTSPRFGFTQGVDAYFSNWAEKKIQKSIPIFKIFSDWLEKAPPAHFSYMHYIHPHFPKLPPPGFSTPFKMKEAIIHTKHFNELVRRSKTTGIPLNSAELQKITDGYDSSIAWVDSEFGRILSLLREKKLYDDSLIIFLADHGEALGEHGALGHSWNIYDETSRVPLIVKYPKSLNLKGRVRSLVELADIFPTITAVFGQKLKLDGRNLLDNDLNGAMDDRFVVSRSRDKCPKFGLRWKNWHYIIDLASNGEKLYLLTAANPRRDVGAAQPQIRAFLKARFLDWYARFRNRGENAGIIALKNLPARDIEEIKTLGYL